MRPQIIRNQPPPEKIFTCRLCTKGFLYVYNRKGIKSVHLCRLCRGHGKYEKLNDRQMRVAEYLNSVVQSDPTKTVPYLELPAYG